MEKTKLLIVDDEAGIVDFVKKIYTRKGFVTFGATDGVEAFEVFKKERPQINLIDVHMPFSDIDGIETLRKIKEIDKNAICIMVTRITDKTKVERSRELGAFAYLLKPMDLEELDATINKARQSVTGFSEEIKLC